MALLVKSLPPNVAHVRDMGSIPGLGISPGEGHGDPLQYSCRENPMDRVAWQAVVYRVAKSWTQQLKRLSMQHACMGRETHLNTKLTSDFPNQKAFVTQAAFFSPLKVYKCVKKEANNANLTELLNLLLEVSLATKKRNNF